jgi:hypothetical protein
MRYSTRRSKLGILPDLPNAGLRVNAAEETRQPSKPDFSARRISIDTVLFQLRTQSNGFVVTHPFAAPFIVPLLYFIRKGLNDYLFWVV